LKKPNSQPKKNSLCKRLYLDYNTRKMGGFKRENEVNSQPDVPALHAGWD